MAPIKALQFGTHLQTYLLSCRHRQ